MARVFIICCVLLLWVALTKPSYAFPLCGCDSYNDYYDDCSECGYVRYPDEHVYPLQVIQGGPTCYRCQPLPYQVQVPLPPPTFPCGQKFGVRVEVPHTPVPCKPCLNIGYEVETPHTPCLSKLPNLPVSVTVPSPGLPCHQPCHVNYELETPVAPCAPLLTNLKTQVDRVVLPCPCPAPIVEGYVPKSETERCKRSIECEDSQCDCGCLEDDDEDEEDDEDDCECDRTYSRRPRSPANWRPTSYNRRQELFPNARTDTPRRPDKSNNRVGPGELNDFKEEYEDECYGEPPTQNPKPTRQQSGQDGSEQRIVSRDYQGNEERIVSRDLDGGGNQERIFSRDFGGDDCDYHGWNPALSSDPVEKRLQDPNFGKRGNPPKDEMNRMLIDSLLSNDRATPDGGSSGMNRSVIDSLFATLKTDPPQGGRRWGEHQNGGRIQSTRSGGSQGNNMQPLSTDTLYRGGWEEQNGGKIQLTRNGGSQEDSMHPPPRRIRLNGSNGQIMNPSRHAGSQDRITTPNTYRMGSADMADSQEIIGSSNENSPPIQSETPGQNGPQRQRGSQEQNGSQRSGGSQNQGGTRLRQSAPVRGSAQQAQGGSQQRQGGTPSQGSVQQRQSGSQGQAGAKRQADSQTQQAAQQRRAGSQTQRGAQQMQGARQKPGGSQRSDGSSTQNGSQKQPCPGSSEMRAGRPNQPQSLPSKRTNSNQGRNPVHCNICDRRKASSNNNPYNLVHFTPDAATRVSDYLDYPGTWQPPSLHPPPGRVLSSQPRAAQPPNTPQTPPPDQAPQVSGQSQNGPGISQPPQPPSPADTSRIVTPSTYDEQPRIMDYNSYY